MSYAEQQTENSRLLIIDDDEAICKLLATIGKKNNYLVQATTRFEKFLDYYEQFKPTLLIIDLELDQHNGIELLKFLSQINSKCPIIIMSGHDEKIRSTAFQLGKDYELNMLAHLEKPFSVERLEQLLETCKSDTNILSPEILEKHLQNNEIKTYFQPLVNFKTKKIEGVEALLRCEVHGKSFNPLDIVLEAEKHIELISKLTTEIIKQSFFQQKTLKNQGFNVKFSINLSGKVLFDETFLNKISSLSQEYSINCNDVCLEITETAAMNQPKKTMDLLTRLRIQGFKLAIDDFGSGYSSLVQLYKLPFTELKIDASLIKNILGDTQSLKISKSIIDLGHALDLLVISEGIESKEVWDILKKMGCDVAQGHYISKALSPVELLNWLKNSCSNQNGFLKWNAQIF